MDIGYRRYVTEYIDFIENISNVIDISLYNNMDININELINQILLYVHENFPAILISQQELVEKVKNIYIQKTGNFKKDVDFRTASIKYDLNGTVFVITSSFDDYDQFQSNNLLVQSHTDNMHRNYVCSGGSQGGAILCATEKAIKDDGDSDLFSSGMTMPGKVFREITVKA